jgi:hypothetical protein
MYEVATMRMPKLTVRVHNMATWRSVSKSNLENEKNGPGVLPKGTGIIRPSFSEIVTDSDYKMSSASRRR